jgi:hypothetical protein
MLLAAVVAQTSTPTPAVPLEETDSIWYATLGFGAFALIVVGVGAYVLARTESSPSHASAVEGGEPQSSTFVPFARTGGLIVIATLAAALTLSNIDVDAKTGAFALLGTIAGYLAATATGRRTGSNGPDGPNGGGGGGAGGQGRSPASGEKNAEPDEGEERRPPRRRTHEERESVI